MRKPETYIRTFFIDVKVLVEYAFLKGKWHYGGKSVNKDF